jgi:putative FmdB family regulatory protein
MPTYQYECPKCAGQFEWRSKVEERDRPLLCPKCVMPTVRVPSAPAIKVPGGASPSR